MTEPYDVSSSQAEAGRPVAKFVKDLGVPILLHGVSMDGVAATAARPGEKVEVWTRLALTSDAPFFHRVVENLGSTISHHAQIAGMPVRLETADTILLVIHRDDSAHLWIDNAPVVLHVVATRGVKAGELVFERDIADVVGMSLWSSPLAEDDRIICLFRQDWRFGLYFDFNPDRKLAVDEAIRSLGGLYRNLRYRHLYETVSNEQVFGRLLEAGWFPFVEIIGDFKDIANAAEAGFNLAEVEEGLLKKFDQDRLERMMKRWMSKPALVSKEALFRSAIRSFSAADPVPVIKIVLTEIEGVLSLAYQAEHGRGAKLKELIAFALDRAARKAGGRQTLMLTEPFAEYLQRYAFAQFDPSSSTGPVSSRHAVSHGAAMSESYTQGRALQALLTLDQFAFYL